MDLVYFSFSAFAPFIYPPAMVASMHAPQNAHVKKTFSENLFWCEFWWFVPHAPKRLGKHRGIWGDQNLKISGLQGVTGLTGLTGHSTAWNTL
jgi:hypothetical protein